MFYDDDDSIVGMFKGYFKQIVGILLFVVLITVLSNLDEIQRWIENFFGQL